MKLVAVAPVLGKLGVNIVQTAKHVWKERKLNLRYRYSVNTETQVLVLHSLCRVIAQ